MSGLMSRIVFKAAVAALLSILLLGGESPAVQRATNNSEIDPTIFLIDQIEYLGKSFPKDIVMVDRQGREFSYKDMAGKPVILVLSYFRCDGSCSLLNMEMKDLLEGVNRMKIGEDFNVLTLSFDSNDNQMTMDMFHQELGLSREMERGWKFALVGDKENIYRLTNGFGYKFFWSPPDRTFFHPNVFIFLSPEGRATRYLYSSSINSRDLELALLETAKGQIEPTEVLNFLVSVCYSYNYKEGRYSLNIPLFVGLGSLSIGFISFFISVRVFKRRRNA
jgi:protein SCO1/2